MWRSGYFSTTLGLILDVSVLCDMEETGIETETRTGICGKDRVGDRGQGQRKEAKKSTETEDRDRGHKTGTGTVAGTEDRAK